MRFLVMALALCLVPAADDLAARLDDTLFRLETAKGAVTWDLARELRDVSREDTVVSVPFLVEQGTTASEPVRIIIGETLVELDAAGEAAPLLLDMLDGPMAPRSLSALSDKAFRNVPAVAERLAKLLEQPLDPARRIDVARTLYLVSRNNARFEARQILLDTLKSDDPETRALGALALAEIKDYESARPVLNVLSADPGPRGRLARAYLETADKIDYYLEKLFRQTEQPSRTSVTRDAESQGKGTLDIIEELMEKIAEFHLLGDELDSDEGREFLVTAAARGMLSALDPHSTYFTGKDYERWILDLRRNYAGIGAYVDTVDGAFTITRPIYSGPAYRAGLMTGDRILKVDGWDTRGNTSEDIIKRLKGKPGTEVVVSVHRTGWTELRDFVIEREEIHIPSVSSEMLPGRVGLVEILSFAEDTTDELMAHIADLQERDLEGLILDLRNNSGGYLEEAVRVTSVFLEPGKKVVSTSGRGVQSREYVARRQTESYDGPLVVLINARSASASEIVSGALQDHGRGLVVGQKSFGKGSVQQALPLKTRPGDRLTDKNYNSVYDPTDDFEDLDSDGSYTYPSHVKITNAKYFLPSGRTIHTELDLEGRVVNQGGVTPDIEVEFDGGLLGWENYELAELYENLREEYDLEHSEPDERNPFRDPFATFVDDLYDDDPELVEELAGGDHRDTSRYPGFAEFRSALDTPLPDETIRLWLRSKWVRDKIADTRGRGFPGNFTFGDWQEDLQLQEAIRQVATEMALDMTALKGYAEFAESPPR